MLLGNIRTFFIGKFSAEGLSGGIFSGEIDFWE